MRCSLTARHLTRSSASEKHFSCRRSFSRRCVRRGLHDPLRFGQLIQQLNICTTICVPLRAADGLWGVLQLVTSPNGRTLNEEDLQLAELFAKRVETALDNAIRFEANRREAR